MLSASEAFCVIGILNFISAKYYCYAITSNKFIVFFIIGLTVLINYVVYIKNRRAHKIIIEKPTLFGNNILSILVTILFFLITTSWLFWGVPYTRILLEKCK
jgi:hypothetical protein